ncbi:extracellular solute-binding protein [Paenibacillus glycanilyticus]|uniref:extracellular solute-binding protein n=1 Tax=Paenibacillus glycanilyticus TaxID=126569 RepID=UPI001F42EA79|nr:extracellular solute-binding protein [Paenibacillus glycanilyticus]
MKKNQPSSKAILLMLSLMLTTGFISACSSNSPEKQSNTGAQSPANNSSTGNNEPKESVSGDADPFGKYETPLTIRFTRDVDNDTQDNIIPKTPGETIESNRWLKAFSEKLGINVTYDWTVSTGDAYTQKMNVTLTSGDLPDMLRVTPAQMKQLAEADLIEDLTPYWEQYASEDLKKLYAEQGPAVLNSAAVNGKIVGLGKADVYGDGVYLWIRKDWLDKLQLPEPTSLQDVLKISEAFTTQDPDGNKVNDTYGLALTKDLYGGAMGLEGFFAGYHAYPNMWIDDGSGKLVWGSTLPEVKESLKALSDMYKAGQLDKEFGVKDGGKVAESIAAGKIGIDFGAQWNPMYPLISNYQNDPNANWVGYALVSVDGKPALSPQRFQADSYWVVRKGFSNPEALIKMFNLHVELNWGKTGDFDYYYMPAANDSVGVWKYSPVQPASAFKNIRAFQEIEKARKDNSFDSLTGEALAIYRNIKAFEDGDVSQWGWPKIYGAEGVYRHGVNYMDNERFKYEAFAGPPTETMAERKSTLEALEKETFVKIIMGAVPLDDFDKFVDNWYKVGGTDITKEVNEWYASNK